MTAQGLIIAVTIGLVFGATGRLVIRRGRSVPVWLPICAGVGSAVLASVLLRMTGGAVPATVEVVLQSLFAATGVAAVIVTADPRPAPLRQPQRNRPH